jgi:hypothetical protein
MNRKEFEKYLARDGGCVHCGSTDTTLIPHHRSNRGMGGMKSKNNPSNIVVLCSEANLLLESNSAFAALGRAMGWKLTWGEPSESLPVNAGGRWYLLDNNYRRFEVFEIFEREEE